MSRRPVGRTRVGVAMMTDPIADFLTRIRNAARVNHKVVEIPASNLKKEITTNKYTEYINYTQRVVCFVNQ